jgi:transposase
LKNASKTTLNACNVVYFTINGILCESKYIQKIFGEVKNVTMLRLSVNKLRKKSRKYPIQRDITGRSARRRAFDAFDKGLRPAQVAKEEDIKPRTAYRYFEDWKKLPGNLELKYEAFKTLKERGIDFSEGTIELLTEGLGMSKEEVTERLQKPWGLKQLLMGKWPNHAHAKRQSKQESRLVAALWLVNYIERGGDSTDIVKVKIKSIMRLGDSNEANERPPILV